MLTVNNKICSYKNQKSYLGEECEENCQSFSRYGLRMKKKEKKKKREEKKLIQSYEMSRKKSSFPRYNVCKYVNVTSERDLKRSWN